MRTVTLARALLAHHHRGDARARLCHALFGSDATLGLALALTRKFYPLFGTLLAGWASRSPAPTPPRTLSLRQPANDYGEADRLIRC